MESQDLPSMVWWLCRKEMFKCLWVWGLNFLFFIYLVIYWRILSSRYFPIVRFNLVGREISMVLKKRISKFEHYLRHFWQTIWGQLICSTHLYAYPQTLSGLSIQFQIWQMFIILLNMYHKVPATSISICMFLCKYVNTNFLTSKKKLRKYQ